MSTYDNNVGALGSLASLLVAMIAAEVMALVSGRSWVDRLVDHWVLNATKSFCWVTRTIYDTSVDRGQGEKKGTKDEMHEAANISLHKQMKFNEGGNQDARRNNKEIVAKQTDRLSGCLVYKWNTAWKN